VKLFGYVDVVKSLLRLSFFGWEASPLSLAVGAGRDINIKYSGSAGFALIYALVSPIGIYRHQNCS
jgi:hypothetical protein